MPVVLLGPNQHVAVPFTRPRNGMVEVSVEASGEVSVYVTSDAGYDRFMKRKKIEPAFASAEDVADFEEQVSIPGRPRCILLIVNNDRGQGVDHGRAVTYSVTRPT